MTSTELIPYEVGDDTYMVPGWIAGLPYITDEHLEDMTLAAIDTAPSLDEAMAEPAGAEKLATHAGEVITVRSAGWRPSDIKDSRWRVYVLFDAELEDGTTEMFSCGSSRVMKVLDRAAREKAFPLRCRVFVGSAGAGGKSEMLALTRVRDGSEPF